MIMVTGGAGYIGSHACVELLDAGQEVLVVDNLINSSAKSMARVGRICGRAPVFVEGDIRDQAAMERLFRSYNVTAVMHFAGLKAVGESAGNPLNYYNNNVVGTLHLLAAMQNTGVRTLVFSSSATVYGMPQSLPIDENHPLSATNPYGRTKLMIEEVLTDQVHADLEWRIAILRYFNPVGAHRSGLIGEDPTGVPNNLVPFVAQVAVGRRHEVVIWGNDYRTPDGTGVRDYIHVTDLAAAHLIALEELSNNRFFKVNLGTGAGSSVLEVLQAFERACGRPIPFRFGPRREGDVDSCFADVRAAQSLLRWKAQRNLDEMCADHWRWQYQNPEGYQSALQPA